MFVGIDVSKDWVDVAVHPTGETWHVGLDEEAVDGLVRKLRDLAPQIVVMEATGGYESELSAAIWTAGVPAAIVNPRHVRDFARSQGILAKTDRIDAAVIARFGEASDGRPGPPCLMRCGNFRRSWHAAGRSPVCVPRSNCVADRPCRQYGRASKR